MSEGMVEIVAKAICSQLDDDWENVPENKVEWNMHHRAKNGILRAEHELFRVDYRGAARAAIAAMREPTEAMIRAAQEVAGGGIFSPVAKHILVAGIDAALSESMKGE